MEPIETYETAIGYSQPTMTSPPATSSVNCEKIEDTVRYLFRLVDENKELRERIAQLEENANFKDLYTNKCVENDGLKEENKLLKKENRILKQQGNGVSPPKFQYNFDMTDFNEKMKIEDIERLMDILLELAEMPQPRGYLVEDSMDVVPIYIILSEKDTFAKGKSQDDRNWGLAAFCNCWNNNVVPRISDEKRRKELYCDSIKIKNELSKAPWKDSASCSWYSLYHNCGDANGQASKRKGKLRRAVNIQNRFEKALEQIPALKSKKY